MTIPIRSRRAISLAIGATLAIAVATGAALTVAVPWLNGTAPAVEVLAEAARQRPLGATNLAVSNAASATRETPDSPEALTRLGAALLEQVRVTADPSAYGRAETAFERALTLAPDDPAALIGLGSLALARHEFVDALELGERVRTIAPEIVITDGVIGDAQVELGRYDEAIETIQHMVDARPDLASYSRVAYLRELHGDLDGAIAAMELALAAGGPTVENTEYVRVQLGHLQLAAGRPDLAERLYRASIARLPGYVPAVGGLARVSIARGDFDEAIDLLTGATHRQPLPELVVLLGETLEADGRSDEAQVQYDLARAIQRLYEANGVMIDLELAAFTAAHGDPSEALDLARHAYEQRPTIFAADTLAWALHRSGDDREADRFAHEALRLGSRDARILYHAGAIADALGDTGRARELLTQALAGSPAFSPLDGPRAERLLDRLPVATP